MEALRLATKQDLRYRYPQQCCGTCTQSYQNTYGDYCCNRMRPEIVIDAGGVCDAYEFEQVIGAEASNCITCTYSVYKNNKPWCLRWERKITIVTDYCELFRREESTT